LKTICAFLIVCIHAPFPGEFGAYFTTLTRVAVPIFFMITGYFYGDTVARHKEGRQIKKILYMVVEANILYFVWNIAIEVLRRNSIISYGSSWNIAKSVFDALGADTYVINNNPNGLNINNNAGSTHIEGLQKFVVEKGLDVGFAYDGDADRCLCVDEKGNVITGDHILYIYGCYMKERGKLLNNTVVTTVMSNFGLYKAFDEQGIGYAKTAVGDKYVYEYMAKNGCRIGGEQSGHIIFSKYASTGDGILTSLKMMEVMLAKKKPMSELAAALKIYPQVLENVRVTDKKAAQDDAAVQAAVKAVAEALGDTGRILVRESGTEPVVRVMVEAPDHDTCQKYVSEVVDVIRDRGYSL
jgi:phosphoglucosamine mutase